MKGIIMFDNLNDLTFFDVDEELSQHVQYLASKDGLLEFSSFKNSDGIVDKNVIMQLFSPLIASYKVMQAQFGNKYKYIESEDGVLLVFDEISNYIVISICDNEEKLEEIQQELSLFLILVQMFFGPSLHMIKNDLSECSGKITKSELIAQTLTKYRILKLEQQMFLIEAIERLIINQEITAMCINLLQEILEKIRHTHKDGVYSHAFALVDTKLLALYSSRNSGQLSKETLLLLILIVQVLKNGSSSEEQTDDTARNLDDEFFIPISTSAAKINLLTEGKKVTSSWKKNKHVGNRSDKIKTGAYSLLVYLKSRPGLLVPHILYAIEVTQKITLVILNELSNQGMVSSYIASLIRALYNLQSHPLARTKYGSFDVLETEFRSLVDAIWKMKMLDEKEKYIKKIVVKWEQLKQCEIESFFQMSKESNLNPRLDSAISSLCELLRLLFEEIIANPCQKYEEITHNSEHQEVLIHLQKLGIKRLNDVADFLEVKAVQNITMSSYITEYPGLIHFIYVDRTCDCLIAPSIFMKKGRPNGAASLKKKIWKMVTFGRKYIDGVNNFCCLWKDDDLNFFYNVWFEDSTGRLIKPTSYPNLKKFPAKGILCGNFYKGLLLQSKIIIGVKKIGRDQKVHSL
ncbi:Hermansky-Pudlak syndrome 1 protein homolog isoform X2 [Stegodyphus dumicola]|uniref:Hermansky-Pudlak syndrome 1 protein homolog isoform X2 n=1 Tax=Stegodyphus dumicola TaxID=202533 RepID=UPI0015B2CB27|nr:Hermansky-Pudlak syndrome 1 protein homolog isoform X2 [Stegodyphus dumicola]